MGKQYIPVDSHMKPIALAWPGGYPVYYLARTLNSHPHAAHYYQMVCPDCAAISYEDWEIVDYDVNWEDEALYCDDCSKKIESAYGEDEEEEKHTCRQCGQETAMQDTNGLCLDCWYAQDDEPVYTCKCGRVVDEDDLNYPCSHVMPELY